MRSSWTAVRLVGSEATGHWIDQIVRTCTGVESGSEAKNMYLLVTCAYPPMFDLQHQQMEYC